MTARDRLAALLSRSEVDRVDRGTDHLQAMREQEEARAAAAEDLRRSALDGSHPRLLGAVRLRARAARILN